MAKEPTEVIETEIEVEEETEDGDEVITPPIEVTPADIEAQKKEAVATTEEDEEPKEEEEEEPVAPVVAPAPKPVEGETPREKALRLEIQRLRQEKREKDGIFKTVAPAPIHDEDYETLRGEYDPSEFEKLEKIFDVIGKKKGYVRAEDVYREKGQDTLNGFLDSHSEYKPENDPEDVHWKTFIKILDRDYNRNGKSPAELSKIFEKVNRDVKEELGESSKRTIAPQRTAEVQKVRSVSHAGGVKTEVVKKSNAPTDPEVRKRFKGFDDDDF